MRVIDPGEINDFLYDFVEEVCKCAPVKCEMVNPAFYITKIELALAEVKGPPDAYELIKITKRTHYDYLAILITKQQLLAIYPSIRGVEIRRHEFDLGDPTLTPEKVAQVIL